MDEERLLQHDNVLHLIPRENANGKMSCLLLLIIISPNSTQNASANEECVVEEF